MPAYVVFTRERVKDQRELDLYPATVGSTFEGYDVDFLAAYGPFERLEGQSIEGAVIIRFADMQAAQNWYQSPAYQSVIQHRFRGAEYHGFIVEGEN